MRLINVYTLQMEEFDSGRPPPYVALSHRWTDDEVTFKDFVKGRSRDSPGYKKILRLCEFVKQFDFIGNDRNTQLNRKGPIGENDGDYLVDGRYVPYVWIDTCCIDKRSSAELSEAINSMWNWYNWSTYCAVFISDVPSGLDEISAVMEQFKASEWFTRGWTLQELLAPSILVYIDAGWDCFGKERREYSKSEPPELRKALIERTEINLERFGPDRCAAQIFSWAAGRRTTRGEDRAYSLLGLLGVNMPLLYGEGADRAFIRLQREYIKENRDDSILAWVPSSPNDWMNPLAESPDRFIGSGKVESYWRFDRPYHVGNSFNRTFTFTGPAIQLTVEHSTTIFIAPLNCRGSSTTHVLSLGHRHGQATSYASDMCVLVLVEWGKYYYRRPVSCLGRKGMYKMIEAVEHFNDLDEEGTMHLSQRGAVEDLIGPLLEALLFVGSHEKFQKTFVIQWIVGGHIPSRI